MRSRRQGLTKFGLPYPRTGREAWRDPQGGGRWQHFLVRRRLLVTVGQGDTRGPVSQGHNLEQPTRAAASGRRQSPSAGFQGIIGSMISPLCSLDD